MLFVSFLVLITFLGLQHLHCKQSNMCLTRRVVSTHTVETLVDKDIKFVISLLIIYIVIAPSSFSGRIQMKAKNMY